MTKAYEGFLAPHLARVAELSAEGTNLADIARKLYDEGVRPPYSGPTSWRRGSTQHEMVCAIYGGLRHALRLTKRKVKGRVVPWIVWTPEMQAIELATERPSR
jgi:hypothetical protein